MMSTHTDLTFSYIYVHFINDEQSATTIITKSNIKIKKEELLFLDQCQ